MKKAIILNAGEGKRLRPLTEKKPKCLVRVGNKTILEHQLSSIVECGIKEVILVVGYHHEMIYKKLNEKKFDLEVTFIRNPIYSETNTIYSLWLARYEMNTDFIFLNGDVFFHVDVMKRLLNARHGSCLAIDRKKVGEEEIKVKIEDGLVTEIGKKINPSIADGEFVGIAKFANKINDSFKRKLEEFVKEGKTKMFFEVAVQHLLNDNKLYEVDVSDLHCIEIDTHTDLNEARNLFLKTRENSE